MSAPSFPDYDLDPRDIRGQQVFSSGVGDPGPISEGQAKADRIREYERQCNGTDEYHRHLLGLIYTDGMKLVAETCGAYWLLDLVASWQPDIGKKHGQDAREYQVWTLTSTPTSAESNCWTAEARGSDAEGRPIVLARQRIPYSDFPAELAPFDFVCIGGVVALRAEG